MFLVSFILSVWFLAYWLMPEKVTGKKYEYALCFGSSVAIFSSLFFAVTRLILTGDNWKGIDSDVNFIMCYLVFLALYHAIYPFKKSKRNQTITFFLVTTSVTLILFFVFMWVGVSLSNM